MERHFHRPSPPLPRSHAHRQARRHRQPQFEQLQRREEWQQLRERGVDGRVGREEADKVGRAGVERSGHRGRQEKRGAVRAQSDPPRQRVVAPHVRGEQRLRGDGVRVECDREEARRLPRDDVRGCARREQLPGLDGDRREEDFEEISWKRI